MNLNELDLTWTSYDIMEVEYSATRATASVTVCEPGTGRRTTIVSRDVPLFKISNSPDDMEAPALADVFFAEWSGSIAFAKLRDAGWELRDPQLPETIFLCHVEGTIVLDIFSCEPFSFEKCAYDNDLEG